MTDPTFDQRFEQAKAHFLAGLASHQAGDDAQAARHYQASLTLLPGRVSTLVNLAATQLRLGRPQDALSNADAALAVEPDSTEALLHRATALAQLGRPQPALVAFRRLLALAPGHAPAWSACGNLLREMHRLDEAAQAFRQALAHGADADLQAYYLASVTVQAGPATAPQAYVQQLFDGYADDFDRHLVGQLGYQAHRRLVDGLNGLNGLAGSGGAPWASALDLGCGTGLCGPLVRPLVQRLTGIDLSERMLQKARALGVYDRLEQGDVVQCLRQTDERFDLVLAADVFIYIGDLAPVFEAVRRVMDRGVFCFSVEIPEPGGTAENAERAESAGGPALGYQLQPSLRYAHPEAALLRLASRHGFEPVAINSAVVRQDQREAIDGLYVYLRPVPDAPATPGG